MFDEELTQDMTKLAERPAKEPITLREMKEMLDTDPLEVIRVIAHQPQSPEDLI